MIIAQKMPESWSFFLGMFAGDKLMVQAVVCYYKSISINLKSRYLVWWKPKIPLVWKLETKTIHGRSCLCAGLVGIWFDRRQSWADHMKAKTAEGFHMVRWRMSSADHIKTKTAEGYQWLSKLFPMLNKKSSLRMKAAVLIHKTILLSIITDVRYGWQLPILIWKSWKCSKIKSSE